MNVFEDLVVELKQQNLLEETVIDEQPAGEPDPLSAEPQLPADPFKADVSGDIHITEEPAVKPYEAEMDAPPAPVSTVEVPPPVSDFELREPEKLPKKVANKEFFRKRAVAEVSSLQMVEHIMSGVEREYMKIMPRNYDDFKAKKALNNFLHVTDNVDSEGHAAAEFELMQETEAWCSALAERDKDIAVSHLREYCENTKPALSSQALVAIARFYRNLPFSENVRGKFDFVMTRLFSREIEHEQRVVLFNRTETLNHIKTLYADWSSIPLYSANDEDSTVMLAALSFDDLAVEAENASTFDQLIKSDFFGRLRQFKESLSEIFLAPMVTAAAVEANVRIGNAYVTLIARERERLDADSIQSKYADLSHSDISDTTGSTVELADIIRAAEKMKAQEETQLAEIEKAEKELVESRTEAKPSQSEPIAAKAAAVLTKDVKAKDVGARIRSEVFGMSRWVIVFCVVMVTATIGLVVWSSFFAEAETSRVGVATVNFEGTPAHEYVDKARVSSDRLYIQLRPSWDVLPKEKRQEVLNMIVEAGPERGYNEVTLINKEGKTVGYGSPSRQEVVMP